MEDALKGATTMRKGLGTVRAIILRRKVTVKDLGPVGMKDIKDTITMGICVRAIF